MTETRPIKDWQVLRNITEEYVEEVTTKLEKGKNPIEVFKEIETDKETRERMLYEFSQKDLIFAINELDKLEELSYSGLCTIDREIFQEKPHKKRFEISACRFCPIRIMYRHSDDYNSCLVISALEDSNTFTLHSNTIKQYLMNMLQEAHLKRSGVQRFML